MKKNKPTAITDFGGSGTTIILLHGFLASSLYWARVQPGLSAAGYRIITIDLMGFGVAVKPKKATYNYEEHIEHIHTHISSLRLTQPFVLVGHSMGALLASRYALLHPAHISHLSLLHPPLYQDPNEAFQTLRDTSRGYRFLLDSRYRRIGWALIKTFPIAHIGKHSRVSRERSLINVIETAEIFNDLQKLQTNTMLLIGQRDRIEYSTNIQKNHISDMVTVLSRDVTHHSPMKQPKLVTRELINFLQKEIRT